MFYLLKSSVCRDPKTFQLFSSRESGGVQGAVRGHSQDCWPRLTERILHTIRRHVEWLIWGAWPGLGVGGIAWGWVSLTGWWALEWLCITCTRACVCVWANGCLVFICLLGYTTKGRLPSTFSSFSASISVTPQEHCRLCYNFISNLCN